MLHWTLKPFDKLSLSELYDIMRARQEVFIVEQNCPFVDADGKDFACYHLMGVKGGELAAYSRLIPPGVIYEEASIGRIITNSRNRKHGLGKLLMQESIKECENLFGKSSLRIMAQLYLKKFYEEFGFVQQGEPFLEDDILHIMMLRP